MTSKEERICEKYRKGDNKGKVHCNECPLRVGKGAYDFRCKANSKYNHKTKEWEYKAESEEQYVGKD